jgi:hypothetical protein
MERRELQVVPPSEEKGSPARPALLAGLFFFRKAIMSTFMLVLVSRWLLS